MLSGRELLARFGKGGGNMPSDFLHVDTGFPQFSGEESTEEKIGAIYNYLFMLLEQLRYTLYNLDPARNMNEAALDKYGKMLTEPVIQRVKDTEGNISSLEQTSSGLTSRVSDAEGNISLLEQTASGLSSTVGTLSGQVSRVTQTVNGLEISTSGGTSYITGDHIKSGTIEGVRLTSSNDSTGHLVTIGDGEMHFGYEMANGMPVETGVLMYDIYNDRMYLYSVNVPLKIRASSANMSIDADGRLYIGSNGSPVYIGDSMTKSNELRLYGDIYINGVALDTYIRSIAGV